MYGVIPPPLASTIPLAPVMSLRSRVVAVKGVRVDEVPVDLLSISAHKIGGPKGVGLLYVRKGTELSPIIYGGSHEHGMRAGTEDVGRSPRLARLERVSLDFMPRS